MRVNPRRKVTVMDRRLGYLKRIGPRDPNKQLSRRSEGDRRVPQTGTDGHAVDRACSDTVRKLGIC